MKRIMFFTAVTLLLGVCTNSFAQNKTSGMAKDIVPEEYYSQLMREGKIVVTHEDQNPNLDLIPKSQYASKIRSNLVKKQPKHFYYTYEALYYVPQTITVQRASEIPVPFLRW